MTDLNTKLAAAAAKSAGKERAVRAVRAETVAPVVAADLAELEARYVAAGGFMPSPQQADFFTWITSGRGSCVLEAVAGAGKTTTLIEALKLMIGDVFFGAYNKAIAEEIRAKALRTPGITARVDVGTMHAAGFRFWRRVAPKVKLDGSKCRAIFREALAPVPEHPMRRFESVVLSLVSLGKQAGVGFLRKSTLDTWSRLIAHHSLELPALADGSVDGGDATELVAKMANRVLRLSTERDETVIDFDDMIYAPLFHDARVWQHDWVLIDEAQDTNATRRELALRMLKPGGRLVAVGDPRQAIYGFTGADADAMDLIATATAAVRLPLTVTYRCPKSVVKHAQQWVSHIQAHESAPEGSVTEGELKNLALLARPNDAVLCRFNAPLLTQAYALIAAGIPARVEGREIGEGLKVLAQRWKVRSLAVLGDHLTTYCEVEAAKLRAKEREGQARALEDKVACLNVVIDRVRNRLGREASADDVCDEIDRIFRPDDGVAVTFASIHKSKGREWHRVVWLFTGPSPWARQDWEKVQEANLCYVAATRAKSELVIVPAK